MVDGEPEDWHFYLEWGMSEEEFIEHCHTGVDAGYVFRGNSRPGYAEATQMVKALGHSVHLITDRPFGRTPGASARATIEWAEEIGVEYDTVTFSADKTVIPTDMFVEDKLENYDRLEAVGTDVYLINRPWNMHVMPDNRKRISSVMDFALIVEDQSRYVASLTQFTR